MGPHPVHVMAIIGKFREQMTIALDHADHGDECTMGPFAMGQAIALVSVLRLLTGMDAETAAGPELAARITAVNAAHGRAVVPDPTPSAHPDGIPHPELPALTEADITATDLDSLVWALESSDQTTDEP